MTKPFCDVLRLLGLQTFIAQGHTKQRLITKQIIMKILKNTSFFLCLVMLFFISCSSEDDSNAQFIDKLELTLSTSKSVYQNANTGDWIPITQAEYDLLMTNLNNVSKIGIDENLYPNNSLGISSISNNSGSTFSNETAATIPKNSYVFAIRFYVGTGIFARSKDNKIKISDTSITEEYIDLGNLLPESTPIDREVFYILKGNTFETKIIGYLAINMRGPNGLSIVQDPSYISHRGLDDANTLPFESEGFQVIFQGLSTTEKQWN